MYWYIHDHKIWSFTISMITYLQFPVDADLRIPWWLVPITQIEKLDWVPTFPLCFSPVLATTAICISIKKMRGHDLLMFSILLVKYIKKSYCFPWYSYEGMGIHPLSFLPPSALPLQLFPPPHIITAVYSFSNCYKFNILFSIASWNCRYRQRQKT